MSPGRIDFEGLNTKLLAQAREMLPAWLPGGRIKGREYFCAGLQGGAGKAGEGSCKVNVATGRWSDFATGEKGGDLVSLYAAIHRLGQGEAAKQLADGLGHTLAPPRAPGTAPRRAPPEPTLPPPDGTPEPSLEHPRHGTPSRIWTYRTPEGKPWYYVARYDTQEGKEFCPWTWGHDDRRGVDTWLMRGPNPPRPLYNLHLLTKHPTRAVMVCEGEKAADAAQNIFGDLYVCTTWSNGARALDKTDWAPLHGRKNVILWPDADRHLVGDERQAERLGLKVGDLVPYEAQPGPAAMHQLAEMLIPHVETVKVIDVGIDDMRPDGWDAADARAAGWKLEDAVRWAKPRVRECRKPAPPVEAVAPPPTLPTATPDTGKDYVPDEKAHLTDLGNAIRLVARHGTYMRYCSAWKLWLVWDGQRWCPDRTGASVRRAKETVQHLYKAAWEITDDEARAKVVKHALKSESSGAIASMLTLAGTEPGIPVEPEQLDQDPWLLNVQNGTLDLRTGALRPATREDYITRLIRVPYDPAAACPMWEAYLEKFQPKDEIRRFLQRAIGYGLTGSVQEQVMFFFYGKGGNGKSTFLDTFQAILGDYAREAEADLLIASNLDKHPTGLADLQGARLVRTSETGEGKRLAEALTKKLTGGDRLKARKLYQDFFEFSPTHKLFVDTNHKPVIRGTDHAIWRRIRLVPWSETIADDQRDLQFKDKLRPEYPGILAWAVRGCLEWQKHGLGLPEDVAKATKAYRAEMDVLGDFLEECCHQIPGVPTRLSELYAAYKEWCEEAEEYVLTKKKFAMQLMERGFDRRESHGVTSYLGLTLSNGHPEALSERPFSASGGDSW